MPDLNAALDQQGAFAIRAQIAFLDFADIGCGVVVTIDAPVGVHQMLAIDVGATREVGEIHYAEVSNDRNL